ncbi:MAG: HEAT repeat domain-containing protein, partial [Pirellulaceae bacterium]|nr:HEAT repeat domain-containing protein [Pirellulaceae bacterium]
MKRMALATWIIFLHLVAAFTAEADEVKGTAKPFLDELERLGSLDEIKQLGPLDHSPKPLFARLNSASINEFAAAWDYLFPESCTSPKSDAEVKRLVEGLREKNLDLRESATRELTIVAQYDRRPLIIAAKSKDIEVELRCKSILAIVNKSQEIRLSPYSQALPPFIRQMADDKQLSLLASKTSFALQKGPVPAGQGKKVLAACLERIVTAGKESLCNELIPVLQADERTAHFATENIGSHRDSYFFPAFLLEALRSKHSCVALEAINWTPHCWDKIKDQLVRKELLLLFNGKDEDVKFNACFPLMHNYHDQDAIRYLVSQADSTDRARKIRAIAWLGDSCNSNQPLTLEIKNAMVPYLSSLDKDLRREAADSIGVYRGEGVIDYLIGFLNDPENIIAQEATTNLMRQKETTVILQRLKAQLPDAPEKTRSRIQTAIQRMEAVERAK